MLCPPDNALTVFRSHFRLDGAAGRDEQSRLYPILHCLRMYLGRESVKLTGKPRKLLRRSIPSALLGAHAASGASPAQPGATTYIARDSATRAGFSDPLISSVTSAVTRSRPGSFSRTLSIFECIRTVLPTRSGWRNRTLL